MATALTDSVRRPLERRTLRKTWRVGEAVLWKQKSAMASPSAQRWDQILERMSRKGCGGVCGEGPSRSLLAALRMTRWMESAAALLRGASEESILTRQ